MAKKSDEKNENLKKYQERIAGLKKEGITPPKNEPTIDDLASQGSELLLKEGNSTTESPSQNKNKVSKDNPYLLARAQVLARYPDWKRGEMLKMERDKNTDNRHYEQFCKDVIEIGNHLSDTKK